MCRVPHGVVKHRWLAAPHGQAVALPQPVALLARGHLHFPFEHPDLLMDALLLWPMLERHAREAGSVSPRSAWAAAGPVGRRFGGRSPRRRPATPAGPPAVRRDRRALVRPAAR